MKFPIHTPKQIEFVEQRKKRDCGVACVAMLTKHLYKDIILVFPELTRRSGLHMDEILDILDAFGYYCSEVKMLPKGSALVGIQWKSPNLNGHFVVWDGKRNQFLDPKYGIINKNNMLKVANIDIILKVTKWRKK